MIDERREMKKIVDEFNWRGMGGKANNQLKQQTNQ